MKYLAQHIIILLAAMAAMMLGGCVNDYDTCDEPGKLPDEVPVSFVLKLDQLGDLFSRADGDGIWNPDDPGNPGSSFDNKIILSNGNADVKWLHVMIINNATDEIAHLDLEEGELTMLSNGYYQVTTKLNTAGKGWTEGTYRLMILANYRDRIKDSKDAPHIKDITTLNALKTRMNDGGSNVAVAWYDADKNDNTVVRRNTANAPCIPMWGVKTFTMNLDGKTSAEVGEIKLLRALAKVKIALKKDLIDAGYTLVKAVVEKCDKRLKICPSGWDTVAETNNSSTSYDKSFNPYNAGTNDLITPTVHMPGYENETEDDGSIVFYLSEISQTKAYNGKVTITATVNNGSNEETCSMVIDNYPDEESNSHYVNNRYNVNRNHLYLYTIEKDLAPGKLSYKLECWNYANSAIGWNPTTCTLSPEKDNEAQNCYVSFPSYSTKDGEDMVQNNTSFADFSFTFTGPEGAVWKAFLIEDGVEYQAGGNYEFTYPDYTKDPVDGVYPTVTSVADTPNGFFFGVGNDDDKNAKAATTGIARATPYQVKIGSRLRSVYFPGGSPETEEGSTSVMKLNEHGLKWKEAGKVPTCYLVIKAAYDGINFTEELPINTTEGSSPFKPLKLAGSETRVQIRQLFPFYTNKKDRKIDQLIIGKESENEAYSSRCWWSYPEGHKDAPATTNP